MTTDAKKIEVLSLGWGVQSWTMAAMMALGDLPKADLVLHADTTYERSSTYEFAEAWTPWLAAYGVEVRTVTGKRNGVFLEEGKGSVMLPAFTVEANGNNGQVRRQCTGDWKIDPIRRAVAAELERRGLRKTPGVVRMLTGITTDEWQRMRTSDRKYIENVYPLVDLRMSRGDCMSWLEMHGLPTPTKSACTFCPYSNAKQWKELKQAGGPDWEQAVEVDAAIRDKREGHPLFVHRARKPLPEAVAIPEDFGASQPSFDICDSGFCWT